jgi:hypothetical protein
MKKQLIGILLDLREVAPTKSDYPNTKELKSLARQLPPELIIKKIKNHINKLK